MKNNLDEIELEQIEKFKSHIFFENIKNMDAGDVEVSLLQRSFISYEFAKVYDILINVIDHSVGIIVARQILREEYPAHNGSEPSHREDLYKDLLNMGIEENRINEAQPTIKTSNCIKATIDSVRDITRIKKYRGFTALAFLRFWGEILTAEEYKRYWTEHIGKILGEGKCILPKSEFYIDHMIHDSRKFGFKDNIDSSLRLSHADKITQILIEMISRGEGDNDIIIEMNEISASLKSRFYDQFL